MAGIETYLREVTEAYGFDKWGELVPYFYLAGWSADRGRPELYFISVSSQLASWIDDSNPNDHKPTAYVLETAPFGYACSPPVWGCAEAKRGGFSGFRSKAPATTLIGDLLIQIEYQRREKDLFGRCTVGGFGELTIVRPASIEQYIFCRWPEDKIGEKITPTPIDWTELRARAAVWEGIAPPRDEPPRPTAPPGGNGTSLNRQHRRAAARH